MTHNPTADCGHSFLSSTNAGRNPFPLRCKTCGLSRCWRCPPCHDINGNLTEMGKRLAIPESER